MLHNSRNNNIFAKKKLYTMNYKEILSLARKLSREAQLQLAVCLTRAHKSDAQSAALHNRCKALINKHENVHIVAGFTITVMAS